MFKFCFIYCKSHIIPFVRFSFSDCVCDKRVSIFVTVCKVNPVTAVRGQESAGRVSLSVREKGVKGDSWRSYVTGLPSSKKRLTHFLGALSNLVRALCQRCPLAKSWHIGCHVKWWCHKGVTAIKVSFEMPSVKMSCNCTDKKNKAKWSPF